MESIDSDGSQELVYRPSVVLDRLFVPQQPYNPHKWNQTREERQRIKYKDPISFEVITPNGLLALGIPVRDCLSRGADMGRLYGGDKPVFEMEDDLPDIINICIAVR